MLSRTADSLYWLARYIERAENTARLLDVGMRVSAMSLHPEGAGSEWHSTIVAAGCEEGFYKKYKVATAESVLDYLGRDPENPSSILCCMETARQNLVAFLNDKNAIQQGYVTYEPYAVTKQGAEPTFFLLADHGFKDYASLLAFRKETIDTKRELVQRFVDATIEGWYSFLYKDPTPGLTLIKSINTNITDDLLINSINSMKQYGIVDSGDAKTSGIGAMSAARWEALYEEMMKAGSFEKGDYWKYAFDMSFINKKVGM